MTNLDIAPAELSYPADPCREAQLVEPRNVPLGGIRAMTVRRTLPARGRPFVGSWCFADHYGPDDVTATGGMDVAPHPHTGLATVSWLVRGEIEHRDSLGTHALVLPGELNLMTAGHGIAHSEVSTRATTMLHGFQLWLALPADQRHIAPRFEHYAPASRVDGGVTWRVFMGDIGGDGSPVSWPSPTVGAEVTLTAGASTEVRLEPDFEYGVLADGDGLTVDGLPVPSGSLLALPLGGSRLSLAADPARSARALVIGGVPMTAGLVMWWNFIGDSHEYVVEARRAWQAELEAAGAGAARYGAVLGYDGRPLPAPTLPGGRLKPRQPR